MDTNFVYSMTNSSTDNEVIAFKLDSSSKLVKIGSFKTMGKGTGAAIVDPLVSQGSIVISKTYKFLFVVNSGSNTITAFKIMPNGMLSLACVISSFGKMPTSLAIDSNLLAVGNVGDATTPSNITLFTFDCSGCLKVCCNPSHKLSLPTSRPTSLAINKLTSELLVSELNQSRISVFKISKNCKLDCPTVNNSATPRPFALAVLYNGIILSAEVGQNTLSSYSLGQNGVLTAISSVPTTGTAACWVTATPDYKYAYVSNTASGNISMYSISVGGTLTLIGVINAIPAGGSAPIDSAISSDGKYFYVLNGNDGSISVFTIGSDGKLTFVQVLTETNLPKPGSQGLASF